MFYMYRFKRGVVWILLACLISFPLEVLGATSGSEESLPLPRIEGPQSLSPKERVRLQKDLEECKSQAAAADKQTKQVAADFEILQEKAARLEHERDEAKKLVQDEKKAKEELAVQLKSKETELAQAELKNKAKDMSANILQAETSPEFSFNVGVPSAEECRSPVVLKINSNLEKDVVYNAIYFTGGDKYLSLAKSKISVFEPRVGALKLCTEAKDWKRFSSIVPGDGKPVVTFGTECDYRGVLSNEAVYVIFTEKLGNITSDGQDTVERFFYPKSRWYETPAGRESKVYNKYLVKDYKYFKTTCLKLQKE